MMYSSSDGQGYYAQQSTQKEKSSFFIDRPQPSWGMVAFFVLTFVFLFLIFVSVPFFSYINGVSGTQFTVVTVLFISLAVATAFILGIPFFAAYHIQYTINDHTLELRAGKFPPFSFAFHEIKEVTKVPYTTRLLGFGLSSAGVCNRFRNVVRLRVKYRYIYLSPSDPDQFIKLLNAAL